MAAVADARFRGLVMEYLKDLGDVSLDAEAMVPVRVTFNGSEAQSVDVIPTFETSTAVDRLCAEEAKAAPLKMRIKVEGLVGRPELNGLFGEASLYDETTGRYGVRLEGCESVKLKPGNLVVVVVDAAAEAPTGSAEEDGEPVLELN